MDEMSTVGTTTLSTTTFNTNVAMIRQNLTPMILLSLLLPFVGVCGMIIFHPWITAVGNVNVITSFTSGATMTTSSSFTNGNGAMTTSSNFNVMVKDIHSSHRILPSFGEEDYRQQQQWWESDHKCWPFTSFVKEGEQLLENTPRQIDHHHHDHVYEEKGDTDMMIGDEEVSMERNDSSNNTEVSSSSNEDIICVNCHALFSIHVDVTFVGEVNSSISTMSLLPVMNATQDTEDNNWFVTLRDVTAPTREEMMMEEEEEEEPMAYVQMDRPLDLHCGSITPPVLRDNGACNYSSNKGSYNIGSNSHVYLKKCQSNTIIEVPYTSFSSTSSLHSRGLTNERIILVSLLREWNSSHSSTMTKRRIVDQWMINIVIPTYGGGKHSSIYSAKLRDIIKYDSTVLKDSINVLNNDLEENYSRTSSTTYVVASMIGAIVAGTILAAFKIIQSSEEVDDDDEELQEEAICNSDSPANFDEIDEDLLQEDQLIEDQSPTSAEAKEILELEQARNQSTPTNLSPLFDNEVDESVEYTNHNCEDEIRKVDNRGQDEVGANEDLYRSRDDSVESIEVEGESSFRGDSAGDTNDDGKGGTAKLDQEQETPTTSNKSNRLSIELRRQFEGVTHQQNEPYVSSRPLFYSPRYESNEAAPLPHSNTSSVFDEVEQVDGADAKRKVPEEHTITLLLSNSKVANETLIESGSDWNEFGLLVPKNGVSNANNNEAATNCAGDGETRLNGEEDDGLSLSCVSKRLFAKNKSGDESVEATLSDQEDQEIDDAMFLPNVNDGTEYNRSHPSIHEPKTTPAQVITSPPELKARMESNNFSAQDTTRKVTQSNLSIANGQCDSHKTSSVAKDQLVKSASLADTSTEKNSSTKSRCESSQPNKTRNTESTITTLSVRSSENKQSRSSEVAGSEEHEVLTTTKTTQGNSDLEKSSPAPTHQNPQSPSPDSHHDLSYVNESMSVSSSPSITSAPRNSKSPSVTSEPHFSLAGGNNSDDDSSEDVRQYKRRPLPYVSRERTSHTGKENTSSNARTPLSARAILHSPSSTVAATVAEFAVPRQKNGITWKTERPVPVPSGSAGQNKRLGGSPEYFEPRSLGKSGGVPSNDESIDFMKKGGDVSSKNGDSQNTGSSRSGKRSRNSMENKKSKSRKRKTNVEKKLLATIKTSDKHKPPSGLSSLSQRLNKDIWEHSQLSEESLEV